MDSIWLLFIVFVTLLSYDPKFVKIFREISTQKISPFYVR